MKRISLLIISLLLLFALTGCGSSEDSNSTGETNQEETTEQTEEVTSTQTAAPASLDNLKIGETADFPNYSITINSVGPQGYEEIVANVTMVAKEESKFKPKYLETYQGAEKYGEGSGDTKDVAAGETFTTDVTFSNAEGVNGIRWNNWSNEAIWRFDPIVNPPAPDPNTTFDGSAAIEAIKDYGEALYPYGFKLHDFAGVIRNSEIDPTTYEYAIYCDVTNEYGAEAKDLTCIATVTGVGTNAANYTVTDFTVQ